MHRFIQEIIHYRNSIEPGSVIDEAKLKEIEQKYTDLLKTARDKYDYEPPTQYYMNGYNLYKRMGKNMTIFPVQLLINPLNILKSTLKKAIILEYMEHF